MVAKALVIYTIASTELKRPRLEATDGLEQVPLEEGLPERMVQLGREMTVVDRY